MGAEEDRLGRRKVWLHGDLDLNIIEARRLPNMDLFSEHFCCLVTANRAPFSYIAGANPKQIITETAAIRGPANAATTTRT